MTKKKTNKVSEKERAYALSFDIEQDVKDQAIRDAWFGDRADNLKQDALGWEYADYYGPRNPYDDKKD